MLQRIMSWVRKDGKHQIRDQQPKSFRQSDQNGGRNWFNLTESVPASVLIQLTSVESDIEFG
jgi:hypothetical protein